MKKVPELALFFHEMECFQGEKCDPEMGIFNGSYVSREKSVVRLLAAIDKKAKAAGWELVVREEFSRSYRRNRRPNDGRGGPDFVTVLCSEDEARVLVCRQH